MTDRPDCLHELGLCAKCGGLAVTELRRVHGVRDITLTVEAGGTYQSTGHLDLGGFTAMYIGPADTGCPNNEQEKPR